VDSWGVINKYHKVLARRLVTAINIRQASKPTQEPIMSVRITYIWNNHSYIAHSAEDCDGIDANVYDMVCMTGEAVSMGQIIGEPV
jgi:hypothetical protein